MSASRGSKRVNYDNLAPGYHRRYQSSPMPGVQAALLQLSAGAESILEAGCGTGFWLELLSGQGLRLLGLDRSLGMLQQAKARRTPAVLVQSDAAAAPFRSGCCDLVFCVNALHHFTDKPGFIHTAANLLRPGGMLAVVGSGPPTGRAGWYVYDYFPETFATDTERFPTWEQVAQWMEMAGLTRQERRIVEKIDDPKIGRAVFQDPFLEKSSCSQLALLSQSAYAAGLRRLEAAVS
ncbi:MAG TPA: methyltransferase domain-containing protein, partial [Anaerolineales bacterium]|nr:methyltransferase domain-containing protein [Anaerolineales bacterium]